MKSARRRSAVSVLGGLIAGVLAGCSEWRDARTVSVSDYVVAMSTEPRTLRVGEAAAIAVKIVDRSGLPVGGCRVNMRQSMPGMQMKGDRIDILMQEKGEGVYRGFSRKFGMGGDWRVTVQFRCSDEAAEAQFDYHLAWPE